MQLGQVFCQPKNGGQMISIIAHNFSHFLQLHSLGRYMYYIISEKVKQTEEVALHKTHTPISTKRREELFLEPALTTSLHLQRSISELKSLLLLQGTIYILDRLFGSYTTMQFGMNTGSRSRRTNKTILQTTATLHCNNIDQDN